LNKDWYSSMTNYYQREFSHPAFGIFTEMIRKHMDDIRSGVTHKGKFISIYLSEVRSTDYDEKELRMKYPQFVSRKSSERDNNWLDVIINMEENIFQEFKRGLDEST